jgi:hypothetical protein
VTDDQPRCSCAHPLWHPKTIERGQCEHCHRYGPAPAGSRTLPYRRPTNYTPPDARRRNDDKPEMFGPAPKPQPAHPDAERYVAELIASYRRCGACRRPLTAGQRLRHLSCEAGYAPRWYST